MKKIFLLVLMIGMVLIQAHRHVFAYEPNYLPGGKNYISNDNYIFTSGDSGLSPMDPFVVKPEMTYTLSFPAILFSPAFEVEIYIYENATDLSLIVLTEEDFELESIGEMRATYSFDIPVGGNYLEVYFYDVDMTSSDPIPDIQLEEGNQATAYEVYIEGTMIDTTSPYFQSSGVIVSYVDQPITAVEIQSALSAYDKVDGDVSSSIGLVNDNYTEFMDTLGTYTLDFSVSDSSQNTSLITIYVQVVDVLAPVFSDVTELTAIYPNTYTSAEIIGMLSASDNYDGDISSSIALETDEYTANAAITGSYPMTFSVMDTSGNETTHDILVHVVDQESPIITGDETLVIGYNNYYSEDSMLSMLSVSDNYDQGLEILIESNGYKNHYQSIGEYTVIFSATDSSGNKTEKTLLIQVVDEIGPMIYLDLSVIQVYSDTVMTLPDFAHLLTKTKELDEDKDYLITVKYDSYSSHAQTPGIYHMQVQFEDDYGFVIDKDFQINVIDKASDGIIFGQENEDISLVQKYKQALIYGGGSLALISTNLIWFIFFRKKK